MRCTSRRDHRLVREHELSVIISNTESAASPLRQRSEAEANNSGWVVSASILLARAPMTKANASGSQTADELPRQSCAETR